MDALKAHMRLLESGLPRRTHLTPGPKARNYDRIESYEGIEVTVDGRTYKSLTEAAKVLGVARQTVKRMAGIE